MGGTSNCTTGSLRLVNGSSDNEGRIEICIDGAWMSLCSNYWNSENAQVACHQLGYSKYGEREEQREFTMHKKEKINHCFIIVVGSVAYSDGQFGSGSGSVFLYVNCRGTESNLLDCSHSFIRVQVCSGSTTGITCRGTDE